MTPFESNGIAELTSEVRGLRSDLRVLYTKLFGDESIENAFGRIPLMESQIADHKERLERVERVGWQFKGGVILGGVIGGLIATLYHILQITRH